MADFLGDIVNLSQAVSGFAQSAVALHGARVQAEVDRDAVKITNTQTEFLQRFNLPLGDPRRLTTTPDAEGGTYWRDAMAEYESNVDGMISGIRDDGVRESVAAHFSSSESQFRVGLSNSLAQAEFQETRALSMDTVGQILGGVGSVASRYMAAKDYLQKKVSDGTFLQSEYNDMYDKLLLPYETEANKVDLYQKYSASNGVLDAETGTVARNQIEYALSRLSSSPGYTTDQKARIGASIMEDQAAFDAEAQKQFDVFKQAVTDGQTPSVEEIRNFFSTYGTDASQLKVSELQLGAMEIFGAQVAGDITQYMILATDAVGRGATLPVINQYEEGLNKQLAISTEAIQKQFDGDSESDRAERLRLLDKVEKEHLSAMDTIDGWKRSASDDAAMTKAYIETDWVKYWNAFKDPTNPQGGKMFNFFDARNKLDGYLKMYPGVGIADDVQGWMDDVDKYYEEQMNSVDMKRYVQEIVLSADGVARFGGSFTKAIAGVVSQDIKEWGKKDVGIGMFLEDVFSEYQVRIQGMGSGATPEKQAVLKEIITTYSGMQKYLGQPVVDSSGKAWDSNAAAYWQEVTRGKAAGVDAMDSASLGAFQRQTEEAVMTKLIIPMVKSGLITAPGQDASKLIPIRSGNDLYFTNAYGGLYAVDSIDGQLVIRKSPAGLTREQRDNPDKINPADLERADWQTLSAPKPTAEKPRPAAEIRSAYFAGAGRGGAKYQYPTAEVLSTGNGQRLPTAIDTPDEWNALTVSQQQDYLRLLGILD